MAGDKTYITDSQGKQHRATRVHAVTPTDIVWSSNPNDYTVQVKIGGKWHRAVLTMDAGTSTFFDNINIDKALVTGADGKQHTALIVKPESTVTLSDIKTDTHGTIAGTTTGETAVSTYSENWSDVKWQDNVNVYKVLVTGSDGKVHTALLTTSSGGGGGVQVIVLGPSPLLLPDAIANSLSYVKAFGGTEQNGTPTPDAPMDIVSNNGVLKHTANIANVNAQTVLVGYYVSASGVVSFDANNWMYQDYIPVSPNTTYTLTMSSLVYFVSISEYSTASDSGFIVRDASGSGAHTQFTITTGANTNFIRFGANLDRSEVTLEKVLAINWMLNKGNSMPYTPYGPMGVYADGTVETIQVTGKNLFNSNSPVYACSVTTGGNVTAIVVGSNSCTYGCAVTPGQTYTLSKKGGNRLMIVGFNQQTIPSDSVIASDHQIRVTNDLVEDGYATFTAPSGCNWILFGLRSNTNTYATPYDIQLEKGSTPTAYQPYYNGGTATAEMLLKVGDYQDVQSIIDGVVTRKVGVKVLDSSLEWTYNSAYGRVNATIPNLWGSTVARTIPGFCTHFEWLSHQESISSITPGQCYSAGANRIFLHISQTSAAAFSAWLDAQRDAGTPVIIVFPLENATTESVAGQTLQVTDGDNTLEITQAGMAGLELEVTYMKGA